MRPIWACPTPPCSRPWQNYWWVLKGLLDTQFERGWCAPNYIPWKMTTGMMADEYMAKFKMLSGRTGFNEAALEDTFIWGLPQPILSKVYSQTSLPSGLDNWKTVCAQSEPPPSGICWTETVNLSDLNTNPLETDPSHHPHSIHICTHGHQSEPIKTRDAHLL